MTSSSRHFDEAIETLDQFFDRMEDGSLLEQGDVDEWGTLRRGVRQAMFTALLDERPRLEASRGLSWPYDALERNRLFLETAARNGNSTIKRQQAVLFLALLPFPGQWKHLQDLASHPNRHPEIQSLLAEERRKIADKLFQKRQKTFKLRHFLQILKSPRPPAEKGVLRIFSLPYLFSIPGLLKRLSRYYFIYMEPPWGVIARHAWLRIFSDLEDPCLVGAGGGEDRRFLKTQDNILAVPLAHGDYLEDDVDSDAVTKEKVFDIVFNALFDDMPRKRHELLLDLLCRRELNRLTALFIGRGSPANVANFRRMTEVRGLEKRVMILDNLPRRDVPAYLARCRMGVQLSLHENVCRSIYECFRSNLPCLVSTSMAGFNFDLITSETGLAARDEDLPDAILDLLAHIDRYKPRKWFLHHSGSVNSSRLLNDRIRDIFVQRGYSWSEDIVPLGSSGPNRYTDPSDYKHFLSEFSKLHSLFRKFALPVRIEPE